MDPASDPQLMVMIPVDVASAEGAKVVGAFNATLQGRGIHVIDVQRVQNLHLWRTFAAFRRSVLMREGGNSSSSSSSDVAKAEARFERRWLFHGTREELTGKVAQQGFNRSYTGLTSGRAFWGKGVYFARDALYSSSVEYSRPNTNGVQHMFLCRVVVGEYCKGEIDKLTPPPRNGNILFDATVDDVRNPSIFVTYNDAQAYPEYLVRFRQ